MVAPEGSEERKEARAALVASARSCKSHMSKATWLERMTLLSPALVDEVGIDDLMRIADYTFRDDNW